MTKKQEKQIQKEISKQLTDVFAGILFNNQTFETGNNAEITYNFNCPEFVTLKEKYNLEKIAAKGSDFNRAKRLLHYLSPRLIHSPWYDNHIPCNSLDLLEYSLNKPEQGINCLSKSKILEECCLAVGIYARRVSLMPFSPYDFDNHVVVEIYDRQLKKWIMLDPSSDGLFVDENGFPLSLLEMREKFANSEFITFVESTSRLKDLNALRERYAEQNAYICKNLFYFYVDQVSTFGASKNILAFIPVNYSVKENSIANKKYRIKNIPDEYKDLIPKLEAQLKDETNFEEDERTDISSMAKPPITE